MTELLPLNTRRIKPTENDLTTLALQISAGELVAFPTDTVYGIGCHPFSEVGINRLYEAKQRPRSKALPLLLSDWAMFSQVTTQPISPKMVALLQKFWPGGLTIIVEKHPDLPAILSPNNGIAVRIPNHEIARNLIRACGGILATSSANLSGQDPANTADEAFDALNGRVHTILNGETIIGGVASTILDCRTTPVNIVREGAIPRKQLSILEDNSWQI